jgi:hypothetical protein
VADGTVGVIANPMSGRDIRRLVASASVFPNAEEVAPYRRPWWIGSPTRSGCVAVDDGAAELAEEQELTRTSSATKLHARSGFPEASRDLSPADH